MKPIHVSWAEAYAICPYFYFLKHIANARTHGYVPALVVGSALHAACRVIRGGGYKTQALEAAAHVITTTSSRSSIPDIQSQALSDGFKVTAMIEGYLNSLSIHPEPLIFTNKNEINISSPLINPLTGARSRTFNLAGTVDGIVGNYLYEQKTTSDTLDEVEAYLRSGIQVPVYWEMMRLSGYEVDGAILDIVKKPTIKKRKGESPQEYSLRCVEAYRAEPDRYFRRVVVDYDEIKIREAMTAMWLITQKIRDSEKHGFMALRGPNCKGPNGWCHYKSLCWYYDVKGYVFEENNEEKAA